MRTPKTIRGKASALLSAILFALFGVGVVLPVRQSMVASAFDDVQKAARRVSAEVRAGTVPR